MKPTKFINPESGEIFIHKKKNDGKIDFFYGPKDTKNEKNHGHVVFDQNKNILFNRNPKLNLIQ